MDLRGYRGWCVEYKDGSEVYEGDVEWSDISKTDIVRLTLHYDGRRWDITDKGDYFQKKRASVISGIRDSFQIESRSIGYYSGKNKVMYTVNEHSGRMKMEVVEIN